jgi:hypothetical protein
MTALETASMPPCTYVPPPYSGPSRAEALALREQSCNPALFAYYEEPCPAAGRRDDAARGGRDA